MHPKALHTIKQEYSLRIWSKINQIKVLPPDPFLINPPKLTDPCTQKPTHGNKHLNKRHGTKDMVRNDHWAAIHAERHTSPQPDRAPAQRPRSAKTDQTRADPADAKHPPVSPLKKQNEKQ